MLNNIRTFGAVGDGRTDDRIAIQNAIADAIANGKGGILIPAGDYRVSRNPNTSSRWSLDIAAAKDLLIQGEGPASIVRLADGVLTHGMDWHAFIVRGGGQRIVFQNLCIDGNRAGLTPPASPGRAEQLHGIEVEAGTEDLTISGCVVRNCQGDGVRLLGGSGARHAKRIRIENCHFDSNKRSGLAVQRAVEQMIVSNCHFSSTISDQSIDFEPSGSDAPQNVVITGCIIHHTNPTPAVTLSGIGGSDPLLSCRFANNIVTGGRIFCTDVARLSIQDNHITVSGTGSGQRIPLEIQRGGNGLLVTGNLLVNEDPDTSAVISLGEVNQRQVTHAIVSQNLCYTQGGGGIQCLSSDNVSICGNRIVAIGAGKQGILIRPESSDMDHISILNNDISAMSGGSWSWGIRCSASPHSVKGISITGNSITGADEGIKFENTLYEQTPVCALNRCSPGVSIPIVGIHNLPAKSLLTGGIASWDGTGSSVGTGRVLVGLGDPNQLVVGDIGDTFQRLDGAPGATFYVKESGMRSKTGWSAK